jgi:hypothetical protein
MQKSRWAPKEEEVASTVPAANATSQPELAPVQAPYTASVCPHCPCMHNTRCPQHYLLNRDPFVYTVH